MAQAPSNPPPPSDADPSMDDILASIRRILSDEEKAAKAAKSANEGVLMLDSSMMVDETSTSAGEPRHDEAAMTEPEPHSPAPPQAAPAAFTASPAAEENYQGPVPSPMPSPVAAEPSAAEALVAPEAAAAAATSVGALMRTLVAERNAVVHRGGPSLEDLVREEIRPLLKAWLDAHLPALVERLVRAEIERVVGRITG